jgi:hypothetical protein
MQISTLYKKQQDIYNLLHKMRKVHPSYYIKPESYISKVNHKLIQNKFDNLTHQYNNINNGKELRKYLEYHDYVKNTSYFSAEMMSIIFRSCLDLKSAHHFVEVVFNNHEHFMEHKQYMKNYIRNDTTNTTNTMNTQIDNIINLRIRVLNYDKIFPTNKDHMILFWDIHEYNATFIKC